MRNRDRPGWPKPGARSEDAGGRLESDRSGCDRDLPRGIPAVRRCRRRGRGQEPRGAGAGGPRVLDAFDNEWSSIATPSAKTTFEQPKALQRWQGGRRSQTSPCDSEPRLRERDPRSARRRTDHHRLPPFQHPAESDARAIVYLDGIASRASPDAVPSMKPPILAAYRGTEARIPLLAAHRLH